ncbi:hypothetical protein R1sor_006610 [Riccia sorocarpa]|uniref:Uncharacterized protein n=1 Tax=Riccia sorocarpa TaxID=122646 RepID=A0ABD3HUB7_9MARC
MATLIDTIFLKNHGPQLPCVFLQFSKPHRFRSVAAGCRPRYVNRVSQRFYFQAHFGGTPFEARLFHSGSSKRTRASRRDDKSGSSESEDGGNIDKEAGEGGSSNKRKDLGDVNKDVLGEKATQRKAEKEVSGFWRRFWGKLQEEIDEVNESENSDYDNYGEGSESEQEEEIVPEMKEQEMVNPTREVQDASRSRRGFWRRWRKEETKTPGVDRQIEREDELLLLDFENLQFQWKQLLEPTPENLLAVGLTALLAFAGLQIIWQMAVVAAAITLSALKYTVLAAIIVFHHFYWWADSEVNWRQMLTAR